MTDPQFCAMVAAMNMVAAALNLRAYAATREYRDWVAFTAWLGSTAYWLWKMSW